MPRRRDDPWLIVVTTYASVYGCGVDGLAALLDGPRARGAFLLRVLLDAPWSVRLQDEAPLSVTSVVRGHLWVCPDDEEPVRLEAGDVVVWVGSDHWTIADDPATAPQIVIHPDQSCTTVDGHLVVEEMSQGVRSWGNSTTGETVLLTGVYLLEGEVSRRLLRALPRAVILRADELDTPLLNLLGEEVVRDAPGQEAVLDRLLDLLLITLLRTWFDRPQSGPPTWYAAQGDPVVGPALRLLQHHPEHPWTVGSLADRVGVSRAAFARRFTDLVGEPPMAFLTGWRLALAADLLLEPDATIASVARQVGYATPFALSAAFKRERGISPRDHRRGGLVTQAV
jgi:AraC-like DNA-binding protein